MASASFRDSMNSLGWSRREEPAPVNTAPPSFLGRIQNLNPFGEGGYVRLPITETNPGAPLPAPSRREEEEGWFACKSTSSIHVHLPYASRSLLASPLCFAVYPTAPPYTICLRTTRLQLWRVMSSDDDVLRLVSPHSHGSLSSVHGNRMAFLK
ncbi:hypothetical protein CUC08_Gglean003789 [Alternaria sp. MG1]|nr:hypothetical protein CUC08_Gglean003789 [Alternaria sp. MG1]